MMITGGTETAGLARDTVFAAVMIVCNGIVACAFWPVVFAIASRDFNFKARKRALCSNRADDADSGLSECHGRFGWADVQFITARLCGYCFADPLWFVPVCADRSPSRLFSSCWGWGRNTCAAPPNRIALVSAGLLLVSLVAVVALAKALTPTLERGIAAVGAPRSVVGIVIAGLVLLPEGLASYRAATANRLQTSMNLALGSVLATIGLTIPGGRLRRNVSRQTSQARARAPKRNCCSR